MAAPQWYGRDRQPHNPRVWLAALGVVAFFGVVFLLARCAFATTMLFTAPAFSAAGPDTLRCVAGVLPCSDLSRVTLYGARLGAQNVQTLAFKSLYLPGFPDSVTFADSTATWTVWATFTDRSGNESCASNRVLVNPPSSSVPLLPAAEVRFYDVAGRRVRNPQRAGLYFVVEIVNGRSITRRVVVLK